MLDNSDYIAIASAVVALCALGASIWQGYITSRHNKLSARPHLAINFHANHEIVDATLTNVGLGPAILETLEFAYAMKTYDFFDNDEFNSFVDLFHNPSDETTDFYIQRVPPRPVIAVGQTFLLFKTTGKSISPGHIKRINEAMPLIRFRATYSSMYDEKFSTDSGK